MGKGLWRKGTVLLLIVALLVSTTSFAVASTEQAKPEAYSSVWFGKESDLRKFDFSQDYDLLTTLDFSLQTKWPAKEKMPANFSPKAYLEWGKNPGLGLRELHQKGYTGKGVNIAYVDQNLSKKGHESYSNVDLHYYSDIMKAYKQDDLSASMHGPSVLSLMAGKEIGVAPDASVYFVANPAWLTDQRSHADSIRKIIEENKKLPENKKIKVIGFSDNIDESEKYPEELEKAVKEAEREGIYVLFCGEFNVAAATPFSNRDNPDNYHAMSWSNQQETYQNNALYIPTDRTTANSSGKENDYIKWSLGGLSWTAPYVIGLMAIGWQINPDLSTETLLDMMYTSAYKYDNITRGGLINPKGFVKAVEETLPEPEKNYALFLYNSEKVTADDMHAIESYGDDLTTADEQIKYLDVKGCHDSFAVYDKLKQVVETSTENLTGIQIFGTAEDVPAFDLQFKVQMQNGIDNGGSYWSDYFYGNADNDSQSLQNYSVYAAFNEERDIDYLQDWPVVRLPLTKGNYVNYFDKYAAYNQSMKTSTRLPLVNFSNPIFASNVHQDDMGYFIANRMNKEFGILTAKQYRLYGNLDGDYPVTTKVLGDFSTENLQKENQKEISDILINSHGQKNNIDKAYFTHGKENRKSILNSNNINSVLGKNYYNLMTWTCNNAEGMDTQNLTYKAMAEGKAMNVFAATTIIANNGVNNQASLGKMKQNNFYYFYYSLMKYYYGGMNRNDSFWLAKRDYVTEILNNSSVIQGEGNYQFNLNNALTYHHFGLLQYEEPKMGKGITISKSGKVKGNVGYCPAKTTLQSLGYKVTYNKKTKKLTATMREENQKIILTVGKKTATVNGQKKTLPSTPKLYSGSVYLTAKNVQALTGYKASWSKITKIMTIQSCIANGHSIKYLIKTK